MPDPTAILRCKDFWSFYVHATEDRLSDETLRLFGTTTINRRRYAQATIRLPCAKHYALEIEITPDLGSINLGLRNPRDNHVSGLGWWDEARCHPFALRWSELERLHRYWLGHPLSDIDPSAAFLLLATFVGHGVEERDQFDRRRLAIAEHYGRLEMFDAGEIATFTDRTFFLPTEDDYAWSQDDELGWVFGGEYPCYSLRNREHYGGREGLFPFSAWARVLEQLPA